jgi:hypothetical protein
MSSVISGSMGVFVPFLIFAIMLFYYLHQMWIDNASESLLHLEKNSADYSSSTIGNGMEMLSVAGGSGAVWNSSRIQNAAPGTFS